MRMTIVNWLHVFSLVILGIPHLTYAMAHLETDQICQAPEQNYLSNIEQRLSRISVNQDNSNVANIAYIIAAAFNAQYQSAIETRNISMILNQEISNQKKVSLLDVKRTLAAIGANVDVERDISLKEIAELTNKVIITRDQFKNYYALIFSSPTYVYLVYGINNQQALVCPMTKSEYLRKYVTDKALILH